MVKAGKTVNYIVTAVFIAALFLFLLSFSISLPILNRWFYYIQIHTLNLEASGYSAGQIREAFDEIMDYLLLPGREFGAGVFPFSASGAAHFADCKPLFVFDVSLAGASAAVIIAILALHFTRVVKICSWRGHSAAFYTAIAAIAVPIILGLLISLDFNAAFTIFHAILFPGKSNWLFDPSTDPIINVLPEEFFMNCAIFIGVGLAVSSGATIAADCIVNYYKNCLARRGKIRYTRKFADINRIKFRRKY